MDVYEHDEQAEAAVKGWDTPCAVHGCDEVNCFCPVKLPCWDECQTAILRP